MTTRLEMFTRGCEVLRSWCALNKIPAPTIEQVPRDSRYYHVSTCAFYRPTTIRIMIDKCANKGYGGRAWSWPGYVIDRTPYGVLQHELGHHVDNFFYDSSKKIDGVFSSRIHQLSGEPPLTGYLGTDNKALTFCMEWFAENFRLFVTNPSLSQRLRPAFYMAITAAGWEPLHFSLYGWQETLVDRYKAPERIVEQARKKVLAVESKNNLL